MRLKLYPYLPRLQNVPPFAVMLCVWLFISGMALLGSLKLAGAFYILSLVLGLYLLWRLPRVPVIIPLSVRLYLGFYLAFVGLVLAHVLILSASGSNLDQVSRIGLGLLNGFIFLALCGFSRQKLFNLVVLMAAAHAGFAILVAIFQGIDFTTLSLAAERAHGTTNPIPFSEMLFTSLGIVAITFAARLDPGRSPTSFPFGLLTGVIVLALIVGGGIFAVFLTGTRGTLSAFVLLFPLILIALFDKVPSWLSAIFAVTILVAALVAASFLFEREPVTEMLLNFLEGAPATTYPNNSIGYRLQLWTYGIELIRSRPFWGHGIDSLPQLLKQPELGIDPKSIVSNFTHLHNQYLDIALKMGLIGFVLFFTPLVVALMVGLKMARNPIDRVQGLVIIWAGGSYAIYGLTQVFYGHATTTLHYGVCLGMLMWLAPGGSYGNVVQRPETVA